MELIAAAVTFAVVLIAAAIILIIRAWWLVRDAKKLHDVATRAARRAIAINITARRELTQVQALRRDRSVRYG